MVSIRNCSPTAKTFLWKAVVGQLEFVYYNQTKSYAKSRTQNYANWQKCGILHELHMVMKPCRHRDLSYL